jgi:hypothetical protein
MHHVRRYTRRALAERIEGAGLDPVVLTYTFGGLLVPAAIVRAWKRRSNRGAGERADFGVAPGWANRALSAWQQAEAAWLARANLPLGLSLGVVVRPAGAAGS